MRVTIVCEDKYIEKAREDAKQIFPIENNLKIPLSSTGKLPATHWMCVMYVNEEGLQKLLSIKTNSIMAVDGPKVVLEELGLKKIEK